MRATSSSRTEAEAKDIIAQLKKGADFADARQGQDDRSRRASRMAAISAFSRSSDMVPEFADAAFALKPGEFTQDAGQDPVRLARHQARGAPHRTAADLRAGARRAAPADDRSRSSQKAAGAARPGQDRALRSRRQALRRTRRRRNRRRSKPRRNDDDQSPRRCAAGCRCWRAAAADAVACDRAGQARQVTAIDGVRGRCHGRYRLAARPAVSRSAADRRRPPRRSAHCGIRYQGRTDLMVAMLDPGTTVAGVFTRSLMPGAPVDWCRDALPRGKARAHRRQCRQRQCLHRPAGRGSGRGDGRSRGASCSAASQREVFVASTGVIGETLPHGEDHRRAARRLHAGCRPTPGPRPRAAS